MVVMDDFSSSGIRRDWCKDLCEASTKLGEDGSLTQFI